MVTPKTPQRTLNVLMNGYSVGALKKTSDSQLTFRYTQSWLDTPGARPISCSLPLLNKPFKGNRVHHYFENLLPDNSKVKARIQAQFKTKSNHPFDLLAAVGKECVGALQLIPGRIPVFNHKIRFESLGETGIAARLRDRQQHPLGMAPGLDTFCLTLPGSEEKAAFLYHNDTWSRPRDKTPSSHILKLPKPESYAAENEWLCAKITEAFGLPVAKSHLFHFEDIQALVIKRFDRKYAIDNSWLMRLPQEDLCQALGIAAKSKYAKDGGPGVSHVMKFLLGSANPIHDRDLFYCSQILFWLLAANDGHAKNFSVFIQPHGKYCLTPLYDITSSYPSLSRNPKAISMAMPLPSKRMHSDWHNVERRHFLEAAKNMNYSVERAEAILNDMLSRVDSVINTVASNLPLNFPKAVSEPIFNGMQHTKNRLRQVKATARVEIP